MSYLDPHGGHTSRNDWSAGTDNDGRDERPGARHAGAAPEPYVERRPVDLGDAPDPYAAFREANGVPAAPYPGGSSFFDGPDWDAPTSSSAVPFTPVPAVAPVAYDVVAGVDRPRGPGRRRAGRAGSAAKATAAPPAATVAESTASTDAHGVVPAPSTGRAGRNLPAAILVGCLLGAVVLASLFIWKSAFLGVIIVAASVGTWEMVRAIRTTGARPPLIPLLGGGALMIALAWFARADALTLGLVVTVLAAVLWRLADGRSQLRRDLTPIVLIAVYVPFLLGFAALLIQPADGAFRVLAALLAVVLSDTGGYAAGVFFGRRPMAPRISPKKSWEGFAGSVAAAAVGSALLLFFTLDERVPLYWGALFGMVIAVVAVLGDLTESMLKRDLGIKDMSQLLPGHGGLMDRLDSIVFAVPTAYLLFSLIAPPG